MERNPNDFLIEFRLEIQALDGPAGKRTVGLKPVHDERLVIPALRSFLWVKNGTKL